MTRVVEFDFVQSGLAHRPIRKWTSERRTPVQMNLFPVAEPNIIMTIVLNRDASPFTTVVNNVLPQLMFDLRISPRFDFHGMNRKDIFNFFSSRRIRYFDVSGSMSEHVYPRSRINPVILGDYIRSRIGNVDSSGPRMALLIDEQYDDPEYISQLASYISPKVDAWNWMRVSAPANER